MFAPALALFITASPTAHADPGDLAACLRLAEEFGIEGVAYCTEQYAVGSAWGGTATRMYNYFRLNRCLDEVAERAMEMANHCHAEYGSGTIFSATDPHVVRDLIEMQDDIRLLQEDYLYSTAE